MALLGGPVLVALVLLQMGGPVSRGTVLLLLVLAHRKVVVAVGAQEDPGRRQRGRGLAVPAARGRTPPALGVGWGLTERHWKENSPSVSTGETKLKSVNQLLSLGGEQVSKPPEVHRSLGKHL